MRSGPDDTGAETGARLVVIGRDPRTALGRAIECLDGGAEDAMPSVAAGPPEGRALIVGPSAPDPLDLARGAASIGWRVLLEPVAAGGASGLITLVDAASSSLVQGSAIVPALRRRHEPDVRWAQAAVGRGAIGLPWGAHAEALASCAPDPLTEALDLADALERVAGARVMGAVRLDRARRGRGREAGPPHTILASLALEHGVVGQIAAQTAQTAPTAPTARSTQGTIDAPEMASLRVTGSHGTVLAELDAPWVELPGPAGVERARLGPGGADRLLGTFLAVVDGGSAGDLASLADAARLLAIIEGRRRTGGER